MICLLFYVLYFWCSYMLMSSFCITSCEYSKITFPAMLFVLEDFCFVDLLSVIICSCNSRPFCYFLFGLVLWYHTYAQLSCLPFIYYCCLYKSLVPTKELLLLGYICQKCWLVSTICQWQKFQTITGVSQLDLMNYPRS